MTDRDTFAAAALTGFIRGMPDNSIFHLGLIAKQAYEVADAMLRVRDSRTADNTIHDAAPAARASLPTADHAVCRGRESGCGTGDTDHGAAPAARASDGRPRTDKADLPTRCGTGDTPVSYEKNDEKRVFYDTKSPRNGALSGCETVPDPDSRVWETPCTPPQHATPPQGSVQGEGSVRDSRNAKEPVAWAVETGGELEASFCGPAGREDAADWREQSDGVIVPLYRHPQPTFTDEEWEAVDRLMRDYQAAGLALDANVADRLRGLLERTK